MYVSVYDELELFAQEIQIFYLQISYSILLEMLVLCNKTDSIKQKI